MGPTKARKECNSPAILAKIAPKEKNHCDIANQKFTKDLIKWVSAYKFAMASTAQYEITMS